MPLRLLRPAPSLWQLEEQLNNAEKNNNMSSSVALLTIGPIIYGKFLLFLLGMPKQRNLSMVHLLVPGINRLYMPPRILDNTEEPPAYFSVSSDESKEYSPPEYSLLSSPVL